MHVRTARRGIGVLTALATTLAFAPTAVSAAAPPGVPEGEPVPVSSGVDLDALRDPANGVYYGSTKHVVSYTDDGWGRYTLPQYESSATPILWLTMGEDTSAGAAGDGNLTLFSKHVLDIRKWTNMGTGHMGADGQPNVWKTSTVAAWLNNTDFTGKTLLDRLLLDVVPEDFTHTGFLNSFTPAEEAQLRASEVTTSKFGGGGAGYVGAIAGLPAALLGENVTQDSTDLVYLPWVTHPAASGANEEYLANQNRVWVSSRDAKDNLYTGISIEDQDVKKGTMKGSSQPISYWSRTPSVGFDSWVEYVGTDGTVINDGSTNPGPGISALHGVRPVTKLSPESILYASPVVKDADGNPAYTQADAGYSVSGTGTNYRLTIVDDALSLSASPEDKALATGGSVSFYATGSSQADQVVYKIVDKASGALAGYGVGLDDVTGRSQQVTVTAKGIDGQNLAAGDYTVSLWAQRDDATHSRTGSQPVSFDMTVAAEGEGTVIDVAATGDGNLEGLVTAARGVYPLDELTSLTVTGTVTQADLNWLKSVNGELVKLEVLDMSGATLADTGQFTNVIPTDFMSTNASKKVLHTFRAPSATVVPNGFPDGYWVQPRAFQGVTSLRTVSLPTVDRVCNAAFMGSGLETLDAPDVVQTDIDAFRATALTSVDLPKVTSVGWGAFEDMVALTQVNLPEATTINGYAFAGDPALVTVAIPKATFVGGSAFAGNTSLTSIVMPSVTSIGYSAFQNDAALSEYTLGLSYPESYDSLESAFAGTNPTPTYYLPTGSEFFTLAFPGHTPTRTQTSGTSTPAVALSGVSGVVEGDDARYAVSAQGVSRLATATIWFEVEDSYLSGKTFTALNGFSVLDSVQWTRDGDTWTGRATVINVDGGLTIEHPQDILEMIFTSQALGTTEVRLVKVELSGYDDAGSAVFIDADVTNSAVQTVIGQRFSRYDVNRDGQVDQLDLTAALLYYQRTGDDADWESAQVADVNDDGRVDVEDFILILNNISWE